MRTRTTIKDIAGWLHNGYNGQYTPSGLRLIEDFVEDNPGVGDCQYFRVDKVRLSGGLINGHNNGDGRFVVRYTAKDFPVDQWSGNHFESHLSVPSESNSVYASTLLKRTNPSRSSVDILVTMAEMREIPALIRDTGIYRLSRLKKVFTQKRFNLLKRAAKVNVMVQFGIMPLLSDVQKLMIFQKYVDQRIKEIERLRTRGLRRTITLDRRVASVTENNVPFNTGQRFTVYGQKRKVTQLTVRGHVRYTTTSRIQVLNDSDLRALALKIVSGSFGDLYTLWELMPWSWMIDYFNNLGDVVAQTRNHLSTSYHNLRIMRHTKTVSQGDSRVTAPTYSITSMSATKETKLRELASAQLDARLPFLTDRQTSILGSLAVLRMK